MAMHLWSLKNVTEMNIYKVVRQCPIMSHGVLLQYISMRDMV